jgi:hypothetical protein
VFVLKSPLGFLLLLILALVLSVVLRRGRDISLINDDVRPHWRVLLIGFFVYLTVCLLSRLDISIRHFTIPIALLILMLAPLPRMTDFVPMRRPLQILTAVLVVCCFVAVAPAYPYFFPFVNSLGHGHPAYCLLNDSNVDWNQSLQDVDAFARSHGIKELKLDWLALSDASLIVPGAQAWDCETASSADAGQWVVVSAVVILENRNCGWLEQYPHQSIARGGMYAFHLPDPLPAAGSAGGPPLPADRKVFFGVPFDIRGVTVDMERHPERISTTLKGVFEKFAQQSGKKPH